MIASLAGQEGEGREAKEAEFRRYQCGQSPHGCTAVGNPGGWGGEGGGWLHLVRQRGAAIHSRVQTGKDEEGFGTCGREGWTAGF